MHGKFDVKCPRCGLDLSGYEYVRSSPRKRAFLRRRPYHRDLPTQPQCEARLQLAEAVIEEGRGKMGTVIMEKVGQEKEIPSSAPQTEYLEKLARAGA